MSIIKAYNTFEQLLVILHRKEIRSLYYVWSVSINLNYVTFSCFMLLVHGKFAMFLCYEVDDDICVDDDVDSNDNDITKNEVQ
jgi:hypothetical protein